MEMQSKINTKTVPEHLTQKLPAIISQFPSPFHIYDEIGIRRTARALYAAMHSNGLQTYKNYFAVKALPNPEILRILVSEGMGLDCSSLAELLLAERIGIRGADVMFTSNNTSAEEFLKAYELKAIVNFDDINHIAVFEDVVVRSGLANPNPSGVFADDSERIFCCRYNPGEALVIDGANQRIIGDPKEAKFGMTREQIIEAFGILKAKGVKRFGLHTMVASNEIDSRVIVSIVAMLLDLANEILTRVGPIELEFINWGGGLGIPYQPHQSPIDIEAFASAVAAAFRDAFDRYPLLAARKDRLRLVSECGRYVTGPHGYLMTRVMHLKSSHKRYIGVDANMCHLMRPGMYGAYHHITHMPAATGAIDNGSGPETRVVVDVVGSLCENNDKFAVDRLLPSSIQSGDWLIIHDTGAHGHAMGFNYNGKLRCAELLLRNDSEQTVKLIRRAETYDDLFATLMT